MDQDNQNKDIQLDSINPTTPDAEKAKEEALKKNQIDIKTIMPTMVDTEEDEKVEKKMDISAIIPKSTQTKAEGIKLESKDALLKSDGAVVLGVVQGEGIAMQENIELPEPIDIEERRKEAKAIREGKVVKKKKRDISKLKKEMRTLNKKTLISLAMIALLAAAVYYIKYSPSANDFQIIPVHVELGEQLPLHSKDYVKAPLGQRVDDLTYRIDTSSVVEDKVGQYPIKVTHNGITKLGYVIVEDKTAPEFIAKNLIITEGTPYAATDFVEDCHDFSGCDYAFEEEGFEEKNTAPGKYTIFITATDMYGNKSEAQVELFIEDRGMVKYFMKTEVLPEYGYTLTTKYEIHFTEILETTIIDRGFKTTIREYDTEATYKAAREEEYGMENTEVDDETFTITKIEKANKIGNNESYNYVINYLTTNNFRETDKDWN